MLRRFAKSLDHPQARILPNVHIVTHEYVSASERLKLVCIITRLLGRNMSFKARLGIRGRAAVVSNVYIMGRSLQDTFNRVRLTRLPKSIRISAQRVLIRAQSCGPLLLCSFVKTEHSI